MWRQSNDILEYTRFQKVYFLYIFSEEHYLRWTLAKQNRNPGKIVGMGSNKLGI